jgi:hypothetical protein
MTTETKGKATLVRGPLDGFNGDARLYRCDPPMAGAYDYDTDTNEPTTHVIVSAAVVPYSGPETYIFPATEDGKIASWGELPGSYRGGLDHAEALKRAGYVTLS